MGKFSLNTDEKRNEFEGKYIRKDTPWKVVNKGEDPFSPFIKPNTCLLYVSFFMEAGLRLSYHPFLIQFLRLTRLRITQLATNILRIILGVAELNRIFNMQLGIDEIKYCYGLSKHFDGKYNLKAGTNSLDLVKGLPTSTKG